ncbi:MAG TPA: hypothetical protein VI386_31070 [Candidatus Sulfotelmatobacter sp.]
MPGQNVPVTSGGLGFLEGKNSGAYQFQPVVAPQVTSPIGRDLLFESRFYFGEGIARQDGTTGPYQGTFFKSTRYLQLDYIESSHITFVASRFLNPFGTCNERLSPIWIQNLQDSPLIVSIGDPDGAMVRGVVFSKPSVQVNYLGLFSAPTSNGQFLSAREAGERIDVYFPGKRVEIGSSYARLLQGTQSNSIGTHFSWEPWRSPLHVRSEYVHGPHAQGYWTESTYRLSQRRGENSFVDRLEPVFRMQQTSAAAQVPAMDCPPQIPSKPTSVLGISYPTRRGSAAVTHGSSRAPATRTFGTCLLPIAFSFPHGEAINEDHGNPIC